MIKKRLIPDIQKGDLIRASFLNNLKNGNITSTPPIVVAQQGGDYNISLDPLAKDWWTGVISAPPAGESNTSDAVYWVRRRFIGTPAAGGSDTDGFANSDLSDVYFPSDFNYRVVNLPELKTPYSDSTHMLGSDTNVLVFRLEDEEFPNIKKWGMWEHPRLCVNNLFDSASDLSDLSATIRDASANISDLADLSDWASDVTAMFVTGHMYKDKASDLNPWFLLKLPLCIDSDFDTWQRLSDNIVPSPNGYSDITGNLNSGNPSDLFIATGHMYKDETTSDLNPWMVLDLKPGPSMYSIYDANGCQWRVSGIDLDSIGRVRRVRSFNIFNYSDLGWTGPEA